MGVGEEYAVAGFAWLASGGYGVAAEHAHLAVGAA